MTFTVTIPNTDPDNADSKSRMQEARKSYTGKTLTTSQFGESWAVSGVIRHGIHKSGSFTEKLTDYSHAFARAEKFDSLRGETIIRDIFKARYGQSMNQMREGLKAREENLPLSAKTFALEQAHRLESLICEGETMPFYRAYDQAGYTLARKFDITATGAKELMKTVFKETVGKDLYEWGKELEANYHEPVREAARQQRATNRSQEGQNRSHTRSRP